jgi:hypothetical protein
VFQTQSNARGDLPPIAATLNKVLKRDAPGGSLKPGRFRFPVTGCTRSLTAIEPELDRGFCSRCARRLQ